MKKLYYFETEKAFADKETGLIGNWGLTEDKEKAKRIGGFRLANIDDLVEYGCLGIEPFEGEIEVEEGIVLWKQNTYVDEFEEVEIEEEYELIKPNKIEAEPTDPIYHTFLEILLRSDKNIKRAKDAARCWCESFNKICNTEELKMRFWFMLDETCSIWKTLKLIEKNVHFDTLHLYL